MRSILTLIIALSVCGCQKTVISETTEPTKIEIEAAKKYFTENNPPLEDIPYLDFKDGRPKLRGEYVDENTPNSPLKPLTPEEFEEAKRQIREKK